MMYLKKKFYEYYIRPSIEFPYRMDRREFAFLFFNEDSMRRHISFKSKESLLHYLKANVPAHVYYSSAYYASPAANTMTEKKWMGADLIFDLDADHLPGAAHMSYEESLEKVKEELIKLLSFLTDDFGFEEKNISIYFSGGRGYHCHVNDPRVIKLGSQERREIVDYVMARGLDANQILIQKSIYTDKFIKTIEIAPSSPGWRGRIARAIISFLHDIRKMDREKAIETLIGFEGIGEKVAGQIYDALDDERMRLIENGKIDQMAAIKRLLKPLIRQIAVKLHSSTDEPVTADIKRLIRLPGSLHGKTGFKVTKIDLNKLEEFDPLSDAIVFGNDMVDVMVERPLKIKIKGEEFDIGKGKQKLPEYLAVFMVARKMAIKQIL